MYFYAHKKIKKTEQGRPLDNKADQQSPSAQQRTNTKANVKNEFNIGYKWLGSCITTWLSYWLLGIQKRAHPWRTPRPCLAGPTFKIVRFWLKK